MSYEIYYDRRFIKIDEDQYIPLMQYGSSNCFDISWNGREIPEKRWWAVNFLDVNRYIFSKNEIQKMGEEIDESEPYKTRYTAFQKGEFVKWFVNGTKNAQTLETYLEWGNELAVSFAEETHYPKTTEELVNIIAFAALTGDKVSIYFTDRDFRKPKTHRRYKRREIDEYPYVLQNSYGEYLVKISRSKYWYSPFLHAAKKFKTKKEAEKYLEQHQWLKHFKFDVAYEGKQLSILEG